MKKLIILAFATAVSAVSVGQIRDEILGLDIDNLTPVEALNKLNGIKRLLLGK